MPIPFDTLGLVGGLIVLLALLVGGNLLLDRLNQRIPPKDLRDGRSWLWWAWQLLTGRDPWTK